MINENNEKQKETMIRELGVFELRAFARQLGVSSPTTKKREELIALILEASKNGKYIDENLPKRGRPFKRLNILDTITNKITPDASKDKMDFLSVVKFAQETMPDIEEIDDEVYVFEGIVRKLDDSARLYDTKTNELVYICNDINGYADIEPGDKVKLEAKKLVGQEQFVALRFLEINDIKVEEYFPDFPEQGEEIIDNKTIPFANGSVNLGRRNVYKREEDLFENDDFDKLIDYCNKNNFHLITLGVNTSFENQIKFKNINLKDNFTTVYGTDGEKNFNKIIDVILYAYNLINRGEKVLIFIVDFVELLRGLDQNFEREIGEEHAYKTVVIAQKLVSFARSYKNGMSGTILMCYNEYDLTDKFLINEVLKISKKV